MKRTLLYITLIACLAAASCGRRERDAALVERTFTADTWERFDYVNKDIVVGEPTTYDLSLNISFTETYPYDDFSMVFTVFSADGMPYRSRAYKFKLKSPDGSWNSQLADGCYTFELPINKAFQITEAGTYKFQIEYRMPITPIVGVRCLSLVAN